MNAVAVRNAYQAYVDTHAGRTVGLLEGRIAEQIDHELRQQRYVVANTIVIIDRAQIGEEGS